MKIHSMTIRPIYADLDAMDIVYYANYLRFFEQGRTEMMREAGHPYSEIEAQGLHFPVTEASVRYRAPARYDQALTLYTHIAWIKKASLRFEYRLARNDGGREVDLVTGFTIHGCITHQGKVTPLPAWVRESLAIFSAA